MTSAPITNAATPAACNPSRGGPCLVATGRSAAVVTATITRSSSHGAGGTVSSTNRRMSRVSSRSTMTGLLAAKLAPQTLDGSVQLASGRRGAGSGDNRHLIDRQVKVEMQQDNQAVLVGQTSQGKLQVKVTHPCRAGRDDVVSRTELEHRAPPRSAHVPAFVGDETKKPRSGVASRTQFRELAQALEGGILDSVFGGFTVPEHHVGELVRGLEHRPQETVEGGLIAGQCLFDQVGSKRQHHSARFVIYQAQGIPALSPRLSVWSHPSDLRGQQSTAAAASL